jgi:hypothetical protein
VQLLLDAVTRGDATILEQVIALETLSNKISLFLKRALNTQSTIPTHATTSRYVVINALEQACDGYRDLALYLRKKKSLPRALVTPLKSMLRLHDIFFTAYTKPSTQALLSLRSTVQLIEEELLGSAAPGAIMLYAIVECLDNVTHETLPRVP